MSKSWHTPRVGPKTNVRPSGPHKQKNRTPWDEWDEEDTLLHQMDAIDEYALAEDPANVGAWDHYDPILIERVKKGPPPKQ